MARHLTPELLRAAADTLWPMEDRTNTPGYSCVAVRRVAEKALPSPDAEVVYREICSIVNECEERLVGLFDDIPKAFERQAARFMWLEFLACVIEDGGL